jgi:hypothetical protein
MALRRFRERPSRVIADGFRIGDVSVLGRRAKTVQIDPFIHTDLRA